MVLCMFFRITPTFFLMIVLFQIYEIFKKPTNKKAPFSKGAREIEGIRKRESVRSSVALATESPRLGGAEAPPQWPGGLWQAADTGRF